MREITSEGCPLSECSVQRLREIVAELWEPDDTQAYTHDEVAIGRAIAAALLRERGL